MIIIINVKALKEHLIKTYNIEFNDPFTDGDSEN